jgi:putative PIN family toxin of toxin-antitoxin system
MSDKPRFVFDTNVIVSALLFEHSVPAQAFFAALREGEILISEPTVLELQEVLSLKKFDKYLTAQERDEFLGILVRQATTVAIRKELHVCRDPKDDKFLDVASAGNANYLITGDADLLDLNPFGDMPILTPAQYLASVTEKKPSES